MIAPDQAPAATATRLEPPMFMPHAPTRERHSRKAPRPGMESAIAALRRADELGGAKVGLGGSESTFHRVARELLPHTTLPEARWLLDDDYPAVRALGFVAAARRGDTQTLIRHVCDRDSMTICPGGCVCYGTTLGEVAQEYLSSPGYLVGLPEGAPPPAVLSEALRTELALRIGAVDGCSIGAGTRATLSALRGRGLAWTASAAAPRLPRWIVLKALAFTAGSDAEPIFLAALDDASLPLRARLTAASGLTLSTTIESEAAIGAHAVLLDGVRRGLSTELLETIRARRKAVGLMAENEHAMTGSQTEKNVAEAFAALALTQPLAIRLVERVRDGARTDDFVRARRRALLSTADHLDDHAACWDIYRDVAYDLERMLDEPRWSPLSEMSADEATRFEIAVRAATARFDADLSCLQ